MFLKVYKSRVWILLFMLMPFIGNAQIAGLPDGWGFTLNPTSATIAIPTDVVFNGVDALAAGDWVGAFYLDNGVMECGGAVEWDGTNNVAIVIFGNDTLVAPDKNGFSEGEAINWMVYRDATGDECVKAYDALDAQFNWTNGSLSAVASFGACSVCQDVPLIAGTRLFSSYVEPSDLNFKNVMNDVLDNLQIAKNSSGATLRKIGPNWVNSIGNWVPTEGYSATMNAGDVLTICGSQVPYDTPIPVVGTKLVSYLHVNPMNAVTAFGTILDNLNIAKNSTGATLRKIGPNWVNSIGNLIPGEGYSTAMNAADVIVYPAADNMSAAAQTNSVKQVRGHFVWPGGNATENTWSIYVDMATFNGVTLVAGDEIAVMDGTKIVGVKTLEATPEPGSFNTEIAAFKVLGDLSAGYTPGNEVSFVCWSAAGAAESVESSFTFSDPFGGAYMATVFPATNNEYSVADMVFTTGTPPVCPELTLATGGQNVVDLEFAAIAEPLNATLDSRGHFVWPGGNATENTWSIYVDLASLNGETLVAGDEIAVMDGAKIVGVKTLEATPEPGSFNTEIAAFKVLGDLSAGYTPGNEVSFKCWDASAGVEADIASFTFSDPFGGAYMATVFPATNNEYSVAEMVFGGGYVPTFNVYYSDGTLVEANVAGTTYQVTGLEDDTEYCFYVTQNLEDLTESCTSNVLCATTLPSPCDPTIVNAGTDAAICEGDVFTTAATAENFGALQWFTPDGMGTFSDENSLTATYYPSPIDYIMGSVQLCLSAGNVNPECPGADDCMTLTFNALPVVTCPADFAVCINDTPWSLYGGMPEGGEYSGVGVVAGMFFPADAGIGEWEITYTVTDDNGCSNSCPFTITVNPLPFVECPTYDAVCEGSDMITFPEVVGGVYTDALGEEVTGFDPVMAGTFGFTLTVTELGCSATCNFDITVNPLPVADCPTYDAVCEGSEMIMFPEVIGGVYTDATGEPVTYFDPVMAGTFGFTLTVTELGCSATCNFDITVNPLPVADCPTYDAVCEGSEMIMFPEVVGGVYTDATGEPVTYFDPAMVGTYGFTLTVTELGCTASCTFDVVVNALPVAECPTFDPVCAGSEMIMFPEVMGGVYTDVTGEPVTGFDPAMAGTYGFTLTVTELGCSSSCSFDVVVDPLPEANAGADAVVEAGASYTLVNASAANYNSVMWTTSGDGMFEDETLLTATYIPGSEDIANMSVTLTLTVVGDCGTAMDDMTLNIGATCLNPPTAFAGDDAAICADGDYMFMDATATFYASVAWETSGDGMFDDAMAMNPTYTPGAEDLMNGSVELCLTAQPSDVLCEATTDCMMLTFNALPVVECPEIAAVCEGSDMIMFPEVVGGVYTDATGEPVTYFDPAMAGTFGFTLTVTNEFECSASCEFTVVVNPLPVADCPVIDAVCEGSDMIMFPEVVGGVYTDAAGEPVTYFDPAMAGTFGFTLTVTNEFECSASCEFTVVVNPLPVADCPVIDAVCEGSDMIMFPEVMGGVYTDATGEPVTGFDPAMAGTFGFTLTVTNEFECSASCEFTVVVNPLPVADCPVIDAVCEGSDMIMFPEVMGGVYTDATGEPVTGFDPAMAGTYMFTLTVTNEFSCSDMCEFSVVVNETPALTEVGLEITSDGASWTPVTGDLDGYEICLDRSMAGYGLNIASLSSTIDLAEGYNGFYHDMVPADFFEYWDGRGVNEAAVAGTWQAWMWMIINGDQPIFYIYNEGGVFSLIDGLQHDFAGNNQFLALPSDYPVGQYTFDGTVLSANNCESASISVGILFKAWPVITSQPVSVEVLYGESVEFMIEADYTTGYQWYFNGEMIDGATDANYTIASAVVADAGEYYCVVSGDCGDVTSDMVTLTVNPWTQVIDFQGSVNGMSTYLSLLNDDLATILTDVLANVQSVEYKHPAFLWTPANVSVPFNEEQGAKVILNGGFPSSVEVMGYPTLGTEVNLVAGNNFIPVWSQNVVSASDVFDPLGADLFVVFSMDYSGIYWPAYNYYTLDYLQPGSSYLVVMNNGATASFDVPAVDASPSYANLPQNITTWSNATLTGTQHNIAITADALSQLQIGDVIGAFNQNGQIAGMVEVTSLRENTVLRTFGDNPATEKVEGFVEGDLITIKVWRNGEEINAEATFAQDMPNQNVFANEGISAITDLKAGTTSIIDYTADLTANLYPNPATDVVNIQTNFEMKSLKVVNYVGQVVFDQDVNQSNFQINTSNYGTGMYFVQIVSTEGVVITKRLTVK